MRIHRYLAVAALFASGSVSAQAALYIPAEIPFAPDADVNPELTADCPIGKDFADTLNRSLRKFNPQQVAGPLDTKRDGRVLDVQIVDLSNSGNGFIGHHTYVRLKGTLYQDGKKVASFHDKATIPGEWVTACRQVRVALRGEAYYIRKWMEAPVDGAKLKHIGE
jgi:hypothetical protein